MQKDKQTFWPSGQKKQNKKTTLFGNEFQTKKYVIIFSYTYLDCKTTLHYNIIVLIYAYIM